MRIKIPATLAATWDGHVAQNAAIVAALVAVNGKATAHAYTTVSDIYNLAVDAEQEMASLGIPKADRIGARYVSQSGENLPNSYKYKAQITSVTIERVSGAWYLVNVSRSDLYPNQRPGGTLSLTHAQDAIAVARLRTRYHVQQAA